MRITVDHDKCIASGACVLACHEVFAQDEDGIVVLKDETPAPELRERVIRASINCPAFVIEIEE